MSLLAAICFTPLWGGRAISRATWASGAELGNGNSCPDALLAVASGQAPVFVVNRDTLTNVEFAGRLKEWA